MSPVGTWSGLVGMLVNGDTDVVTAGLTQTVARSRAIDFTVPIYPDRLTLVEPVHGSNGGSNAPRIWVYLDIFTSSTWLVIIASLFAFAALFQVIRLLGSDRFHRDRDPEAFLLHNSLGAVAVYMLQRSYGDNGLNPRRISSRMLNLTASLFAYLVYSYYASDLTSRMTSSPPASPVRSFADVIAGDYRVIVKAEASGHEVLATSKPGTAMHEVYHGRMLGREAESVFPSSESAKAWLYSHPKTFYFADDLSALVDSRMRPLTISDGFSGHLAFGLRRDSELADLFNFHLQKMEEDGVMARIKDEWLLRADAQFWLEEAGSLGFDMVTWPFSVVGGGAVVAIALFLPGEVFWRLFCKRKSDVRYTAS